MNKPNRISSNHSKLGPLFKRAITWFIFLLIANSFLNCAAPKKIQSADPSLPEIDVLQLKENSDEALKLAQENKLDLQALTVKVHELETKLASLNEEVGTLPVGKLDEHTTQISLLTEQLRGIEEKLAKPQAVIVVSAPAKKKGLETFSPATLDTTKAPPTPPTFKPDSLLANTSLTKNKKEHDSAAKSKTSGKGKVAKKSAEVKGEAEPKAGPRKPPGSEAEAALYKKAFDLYYGRDYDGAIINFGALLQKFTSTSYADNCHYWIGESQFALGNFSKAIDQFHTVLTYKGTEKGDDAQLKLGYCFLRLGDRKQAAAEFKKVVSLYPESEYIERAKDELAKLE